MTTYIYELKEWPGFRWNDGLAVQHLAAVRHRQGRLIGRMEALGFDLRAEAVLQRSPRTSSSPARSKARSSTAIRCAPRSRAASAWTSARLTPADRNVEGVVEMMLDATQQLRRAADRRAAVRWHAALFPDRAQRHDEDHRRRLARRQHRTDAGRLRPDRAASACTTKRRRRSGSTRRCAPSSTGSTTRPTSIRC